MDSKIRQFVYRVRARLREEQIIENIIKLAGIGLFIAVILSFISMVVPFYYAVPAAVGIVGLCFVLGIIIGIIKTPTPMDAALKADAKGYKEKISTAFFLRGKDDVFSILQKKDAIEIMDTFRIRKEFPLKLQWKRILILVGLSLVFVVSSLVDTPAREAADIRKDVDKEAKEDIARLEKVEKKLAENKEISKTEAAEIEEQIENAKRELSDADSAEDLKKAEERMIKKLEMASEKTQNKTLKETMGEAAKEAREAAEKKESDLAKEAKEALARAENGNRRDKQEAYKKLKKLAAATSDERLKEAAEEYRDSGYSDGDYAAAKRELNAALEDNSTNQPDLASDQNSANSQGSQNNSQNNGSTQTDNGNQNGNQQNNPDGNGNQNSSQGNNSDGNGNQNSSQGNNSDGNENQNGSNSQNGNGNQNSGTGKGQG
ncbi:MAG: hypothetical protein K2H34_09060, partial [Lachnospiraceae bacterium]|nr:hypothetical protein [Lachnospiraceae bacterium]